MNDQDHGEAQKILYNSYEKKSVLGGKERWAYFKTYVFLIENARRMPILPFLIVWWLGVGVE